MMERKTRKEKEDLESQYKKKQQSSLSDNKSQMMRKQIESQMVQNNLRDKSSLCPEPDDWLSGLFKNLFIIFYENIFYHCVLYILVHKVKICPCFYRLR